MITVSMSFIATAAAISYTGATPVFVDVDPKTVTMDEIEKRSPSDESNCSVLYMVILLIWTRLWK